LLKPPDVVKNRYHLGYTLLIVRQSQLISQIPHLLTGPPTVLLFQFQVGIDELIVAVKAGHIIIKPGPEFL
jgi:hypothetical protein